MGRYKKINGDSRDVCGQYVVDAAEMICKYNEASLSPCPALGKTALGQQNHHVKPKAEFVLNKLYSNVILLFDLFRKLFGYTLAIFERRRQDELLEKLLRPVRLRPMLRPPPRAFTICQSLQALHASQPPAVSAWLCRPRETVAERRSQRWMAQIAVPRVIRGL